MPSKRMFTLAKTLEDVNTDIDQNIATDEDFERDFKDQNGDSYSNAPR